MYNLEEIGSDGRSRRKAMGLTQEEVARRSCIHRNDVIKIEKGKFTGRILTVAFYLQTLGMTLTTAVKHRPTIEEMEDFE